MVTSLLNERAIPIFVSSVLVIPVLSSIPDTETWTTFQNIDYFSSFNWKHYGENCTINLPVFTWHACDGAVRVFHANQTTISISGGQRRQKEVCVRMSRDVACFDNHIEDDQDCYQETNVFWPTPPTMTNGNRITNTRANTKYKVILWQLRLTFQTRAEYLSVHSWALS